MTTVFPGAVDALPRPGASTFTDDSGYELDLVIDNISDAIEATETRVRMLGNAQMVNGTLVPSVASNALTIAVKTIAGNDPSSSDPVRIFFRAATGSDGGVLAVDVTAALSITVSSGSTLGTSNNAPFRVWVVCFYDSGTLRLGVINCLSGTSVYQLGHPMPFVSSTAEGGAGAADSAHVFYSGTAVTLKMFTVLGWVEYTSGLSTAGTWASTPSRVALYSAQMPLPGEIVQVQSNITGAVSSGSTQIPLDDTIPQSTEGVEYMTQAIIPTSAANLLEVNAAGQFASSAAASVSAALFQDSGANALSSGIVTIGGVNFAGRITLWHRLLANQITSTTFRLRAGAGSAVTVTFNGAATARLHGGVLNSMLEVKELMA